MITENNKKSRILIVDDVPMNIQVLATILKDAGYQLGFAKDGTTALKHIESTGYDLVLLDIMMPDLDGYEVCRRLKSDERKKDVPVIFITARNDTEDKTRGFELGAVDYITKPFDAQEVLARVNTHLTIRTYALTLEHMVEERTRQLIHADRLATLGTFSAAIVHEINNPLSYIQGNAQLMQFFVKDAKPVLERHVKEDETGHLPRDLEDADKWLQGILDGSNRIARLVDSLRTYSRQGDSQRGRFKLADIVADAINLVGYKLKVCGVTTEIDVPQGLMVHCDLQRISQVFVNLLNNACDAMEGRQGKIRIQASQIDERIDIRVCDNGPGISCELADRIFDPFFTTKEREKGTGLGLFIVRNIVEEHKGGIAVLPSGGGGAEFKITLPQG